MYKILRIHNRLIVGGPSLNVTLLSCHLGPEFETRLVVGKKETHEKDAGYLAAQMGISPVELPQMRRSIRPFSDIRAYFKMIRIIREFKPDIVHTHASKSGAIGRLAAITCKVPLIVHTFHGHVFHSYFNRVVSTLVVWCERLLAKKTDAIIAISDLQKKELVQTYRIANEQKVFTIPLGFNLEKYAINQPKKRDLFREKYGFQPGEIVIGIIGRIVPIKNYEMFVRVAATIKMNTHCKVRFAIVGDGAELPVLEQQIVAGGLSFSHYLKDPQKATDVVLTSWETEIDQVMAGLDVVVLTSWNEGTPVSLIEAQAAGKPVVATNVGGVPDVITHGVNGYLTAVNEVHQFANYVLMLINDKTLRETIGTAGHHMVIQRFSRQRLVRDVKELYLSFLEKNTNPGEAFYSTGGATIAAQVPV